jgi:uroporphyrinogen decarboxylase
VEDDLLVVGTVLGPLTLTTQLMGMEKALYLAIDAPDEFMKVLAFATEVITIFGKAQLKAGAHLTMIFDPASSPAVVPANFFREFSLPLITRAFAEFKREGSLANWLHIAGPVEPIFPYYESAGAEIANLDYQVEPSAARRQFSRICVNGNLKSSAFICSSPEEIYDASLGLLEAFQDRGGFILSSGCEIPPESRPENVAALVAAARSRGGAPCLN